MAYIVTAKMFVLTVSGLLKEAAVRGREFAQNYKPRSSSSVDYTKFMNRFNSTTVFGTGDFGKYIMIYIYKSVFQ